MKRKPTTLKIGEYSSGTLRVEDLLDACEYAASTIRMSRANRMRVNRLIKEARSYALPYRDDSTYAWEILSSKQEDAGEIYESLADILGGYCPDYCYWGSIEGDGACIGVWPDMYAIDDARHDGELIDLDKAPKGYSGLACFVSDHGNLSIYLCRHGVARELWAIV